MSAQDTETAMRQLKKDWADLAARVQVSEVGLDVDRAGLIARYRDEEELTQKQIAESLDLGQQTISQLLIYGRYIASTATGGTRISERRFRDYWKQIADPKLTRGRREVDADYEALCFADIRALVKAGTPPQKRSKRPKDVTADDIRSVKDVLRAARKVYNGALRTELKKLKQLLGADRSTYAPTLLADAATIIEREIKKLFHALGAVPDDATESVGG